MTSLAIDMRELSFDEIDMVSGADADRNAFVQNVAAGLLVGAFFVNPVLTVGVIAVGAVVFGATAAH